MRRYRLFLHAFPKAWRGQYGRELLSLLEDDPSIPRWPCVNLLHTGLQERAHCLVAGRDRRRTESAEVLTLRRPDRPRAPGRWAATAVSVVLLAGIALALANYDGGGSPQHTVPIPGTVVSTPTGHPILPVTLAGKQSRHTTRASRRVAVAVADRSAARATRLVAERRVGAGAVHRRDGVASADLPLST